MVSGVGVVTRNKPEPLVLPVQTSRISCVFLRGADHGLSAFLGIGGRERLVQVFLGNALAAHFGFRFFFGCRLDLGRHLGALLRRHLVGHFLGQRRHAAEARNGGHFPQAELDVELFGAAGAQRGQQQGRNGGDFQGLHGRSLTKRNVARRYSVSAYHRPTAPPAWRATRFFTAGVRCGNSKTFPLSLDARFQQDRRAQRPPKGRFVPAFALRHPEARGDAPALRPAAGAGRRVQVLGGDARALAQSAGQAAVSRGRRSSAGLRRLRRHDSQGRIRRRHGAAVGSGLLGARRQAVARAAAAKRRTEIQALRRSAARQLGDRAHEGRPLRQWQTQQLVAHQASRRVRARGGRSTSGDGRRPLGRFEPPHGRHRGRQRSRAKTFHDEEPGRRRRRGMAFQPQFGDQQARACAQNCSGEISNGAQGRSEEEVQQKGPHLRSSSSPSCASPWIDRRADRAGATK